MPPVAATDGLATSSVARRVLTASASSQFRRRRRFLPPRLEPLDRSSQQSHLLQCGTLTGGITVGQSGVTDGTIAGTQELPYGYIRNANIHNNSVTNNTAYGDELNSTTPMAAGGVTFCTGSDNYKFNHNWVCGNLSTGDGGGFAHFGLSYNGNISNNWFLFNQSTNPSIPTHGGGVLVAGAPPYGCRSVLI